MPLKCSFSFFLFTNEYMYITENVCFYRKENYEQKYIIIFVYNNYILKIYVGHSVWMGAVNLLGLFNFSEKICNYENFLVCRSHKYTRIMTKVLMAENNKILFLQLTNSSVCDELWECSHS
jgi:hypothetical protein